MMYYDVTREDLRTACEAAAGGEMNLTEWVDLIGGLAGLATAIAAFIAALVAVKGLNTWRHQMKVRVEHDVCMRILRNLFVVRNAIETYRNAINFVHEPSWDAKPKPGEEESEHYDAMFEKCRVRWHRVADTWSILQADLVEAEVLWGDEIRKASEPLRDCLVELQTETGTMMLAKHPVHGDGVTKQQFMKSIAAVFGAAERDAFGEQAAAAVSRLEEEVKSHMPV